MKKSRYEYRLAATVEVVAMARMPAAAMTPQKTMGAKKRRSQMPA